MGGFVSAARIVRAVYSQPADPPVTTPLREYLPTGASVRLMAEHPEMAEWLVHEHQDRSVRWVVIAERTTPRPYVQFSDRGQLGVVADVDTILSAVAGIIDQP